MLDANERLATSKYHSAVLDTRQTVERVVLSTCRSSMFSFIAHRVTISIRNLLSFQIICYASLTWQHSFAHFGSPGVVFLIFPFSCNSRNPSMSEDSL